MTGDDILDLLDNVGAAVTEAVRERGLDLILPEGGSLALVRISKREERSFHHVTLTVETQGGLRVPLTRRLHDGPGSSDLDRDALVRDLLTTIEALSGDGSHDETYHELLLAVDEAFGSARADRIPLHRVRLAARPLAIGTAEPRIGYELTSRMLGTEGDARTFVMRVADAEDFRACFADEIRPEQRARAARAAGLDVPEAVND